MNREIDGLNLSKASEPNTFRVLVVDDNILYAQAISKQLLKAAMEPDVALCAADALSLSERNRYQIILLDHKLPDDDGIRIIPVLMGRQPGCSLVVMTAYGMIQSAIQAIRQGAEDYIVKETSIQPVIDRVLEIKRRNQVRGSGQAWEEYEKDGLIGQSPPIMRVREQIEKVASRADTTVLFTGETGVGKEVAARYLHKISTSAESRFVSVDCVALPENLVESLLFGHEKGAFTGAHRTKKGIFEEASHGTVFLDEIGDMALSLQGKLLRVLESRRFRRVGSVQEYPVLARVVAATNRNLKELATRNRFRFDLYQRLAVFPIHIPALRERGNDILLAARHFAAFFCLKMGFDFEPLSKEVENQLLNYEYPGNVRELKNILERAVILSGSGRIEPKHLPERILTDSVEGPSGDLSRTSSGIDFIPGVDTMDTLEAKLIHHALAQTGGAKTEAAKLLGISRYQLLRRMQKHGMKLTNDIIDINR